jgi:hypothetical protein
MANPIGEFGNRKLFDDSEVVMAQPVKMLFSESEQLHWPFTDAESAFADHEKLQAICDKKIEEDAEVGIETHAYCKRPFQVWLNLKPCIIATDSHALISVRANAEELSGTGGMPPLPGTFWKLLEEPIPDMLPSASFGKILDFCENVLKPCPVCNDKTFTCPKCNDSIRCPFCKQKILDIGGDLLFARPILDLLTPVRNGTRRSETILIQHMDSFTLPVSAIENEKGLRIKSNSFKCPTTVRFFDRSGRWLAIVCGMIKDYTGQNLISMSTNESYPVLETRRASTRT